MNTFIINYDKSLDEIIAEGKYDWVRHNITQNNFGKPSQTGQANLEWEIFNFPGERVSSEEAIAIMEAKGFRPATHFELAAFGAQYPEEQQTKWIVGLGSSWIASNGNALVAWLYGTSSCRLLDLSFWEGRRGSSCCFLGVRQVSDTVDLEPSALSSSEPLPLELVINGVVYVPKGEHDLTDIRKDLMSLANKVAALSKKK